MKVLILTSEEWNDKKYGNNNMSNWFAGFDNIELAHVYCSNGKPDNRCCLKYFQIPEMAMMRSIVKDKPAGRSMYYQEFPSGQTGSGSGKTVPAILKTELARAARDCVWTWGKINEDALHEFLEAFQPDIVFSQRKASIRILRAERAVKKLVPNVPFVVYTADDEYSLKQFSLNPIFWLRRFAVRAEMRKNVSFYDKYYTDAEAQSEEYRRIFGVETDFLAKCGTFDRDKCHIKVNTPIRIVYAGKLYCNRWKTLEHLAKAIAKINERQNRPVFHMEIYTQSPVTKRQRKHLDNQTASSVMGRVSAEKVLEIYREADIVLHVESFDLANRLATRYSFSTKIIDCMATGCALMAICDKAQNGLAYLRKQDAAITVDDPKKLTEVLEGIAERPEILLEYAKKAIDCGMRNHSREVVQRKLYDDFSKVINKRSLKNS